MSSGQRRECAFSTSHSVDEQNGIGADTDVECFTIVTQDSSGSLEVLSKSGHWIKADPIPGAFVVNIADCFMRRTDDFFVSTINRAINKSGMHLKTATILFALSSTVLAEYITVFHASCSPAPPAAYNDSLRNWRQRICETELKGSYYDEDDQCQVVDPVTADTKKVYHPTLGAAGQPNIKTRCTWS
ncbi:2OG-Fe(II)oxygenase superfamily protein [Colletotrichum limetticola]|uniref:2OG-Fe(II)oxygenase superfamily protein n=1 Tax=Colletotrichum limetticola TaxID=1209924 RepID=A0ABQ9Q577_9PEZI|nr:2OG-Fe(II)oxygenase superfamily protein [Colletotrichum limetticola]